jgi:PAS domain S-box-containing protein
MQLRTRLLALPVVAIAPAVALLLWNQRDLDESRHEQIEQLVLNQAKQVSAEVDRIAEGALQFLVALAQIPQIRDDGAECNNLLSGIRANYGAYLAIIRANMTGDVTCSSIGPGPNIRDRLYFKKAIDSKGFSVGEFTHGRGTKADTIHFSYPLKSDASEVTGVIAAALDLDWFAQRLSEKLLPSGALNVADSNGTMLVRLPKNEKFRGQPVPAEFRWIIYSPAPSVTRVVGLEGNEQLLGFVPIPASPFGFHVGVATDLEPAFADIRRAQRRGLLFIGSGLAVSLLLGALWAELGIRRPVGTLLQAVQRWRTGDYEPTNRSWDKSEFGQVGQAFDQLVSTATDREEKLRASEQRLAAHQKYLSTVLDEVPAGIMQVLPDRTYGFVNRGFCDLLGRPANELLGHSFLEFTHPDDEQKDAEQFDVAVTQSRSYCHRKRYVRPDGSTIWTENTVTNLGSGQGLLAVSVDMSERLQAERMQKRLTDELNHRVKNTLATVTALITIASRYSGTTEQLVKNFTGRIKALSVTHNVLTDHAWEQANLKDLIASELEPYSEGKKVTLEGPDVLLGPRQAISFGLIVHELATNAAKYGALSTVSGKLGIEWSTQNAEGKMVTLTWQETGLDGVAEPAEKGFGSRLIHQCLKDLRGSVSKEFRSTGLVCIIKIPV